MRTRPQETCSKQDTLNNPHHRTLRPLFFVARQHRHEPAHRLLRPPPLRPRPGRPRQTRHLGTAAREPRPGGKAGRRCPCAHLGQLRRPAHRRQRAPVASLGHRRPPARGERCAGMARGLQRHAARGHALLFRTGPEPEAVQQVQGDQGGPRLRRLQPGAEADHRQRDPRLQAFRRRTAGRSQAPLPADPGRAGRAGGALPGKSARCHQRVRAPRGGRGGACRHPRRRAPGRPQRR